MSPTLSETDLAPIADSLYRGERIQAIVRYREVHPVGLAEAKHAAEQIESGLRASSPEKFVVNQASRLTVLLMVVFHCTYVSGALILSIISANRIAQGEHFSFRLALPIFLLPLALTGAVTAFRRRWVVMAKL